MPQQVHRSLVVAVTLAVSLGAIAAHGEDGPNERPDATPAGVVTEQMTAMSAWRVDQRAATRVFALASDANRAVSGPIDRFRAMVEAPPYDALLDNRGWVVGRAVEAGDAAAVLVTLVTPTGELQAFRFLLSRQAAEGGAWRTDAVFRTAIDDGSPAI